MAEQSISTRLHRSSFTQGLVILILWDLCHTRNCFSEAFAVLLMYLPPSVQLPPSWESFKLTQKVEDVGCSTIATKCPCSEWRGPQRTRDYMHTSQLLGQQQQQTTLKKQQTNKKMFQRTISPRKIVFNFLYMYEIYSVCASRVCKWQKGFKKRTEKVWGFWGGSGWLGAWGAGWE